MPKKIEDNHYIFGFAHAGFYKDIKFPALIETTSDEFKSNSDYIEVLGERIDKKIYYPAFLERSSEIVTGNIITVINGIELLQRPSKFADYIINLREKYGYSKLIYLQGVSDPYLIPVLVYMGINIFDDIYIRMESLDGIKYSMTGKSRVDYDPLKDNIVFVKSMLESLFDSIRDGTLREVVEKIQISSLALELLRIMDEKYYKNMENIFPTITPYIKANSIESLTRPDIVRYRNNIENYEKPAGRNIALILPCSAKKPYSLSKTHQKIIQKISKFRKYLHELIVTSPVGLVPRELENSYPARFYDIPVIGLWYEDEKLMMKNLLKNYLKKNQYDYIIGYYPDDLNFISDILPENSTVINGRVTDDSNLDRLYIELEKITKTSETRGNVFNDYISVLKYQFGGWIYDYVKNLKLVNNFHQDMLVNNGKVYFVFNQQSGKFTITKNSAPFFLNANKFIVSIEDFKPTSYVYSMGINNATDDIKPYDEVVLVHNNEIRGVGTALMPSSAMINLNEGMAVKVRG